MASLLQQLLKDIDRLEDQRSGKENTLTTIAPEEKVRIEQQIEDLKEQMARKRREFWEALAERSDGLMVAEPEAEAIVTEIVGGVGRIEAQSELDYSEEMLGLLREIRDKLNEPGSTAAAKLKGIISSFPPFIGVTYEAELDTEQVIRKYFPTFRKWYLTAAKK